MNIMKGTAVSSCTLCMCIIASKYLWDLVNTYCT